MIASVTGALAGTVSTRIVAGRYTVAHRGQTAQDSGMTRIARRSGPIGGVVLALAFILVPGAIGPANVSGAAAALPAWHGGIDLYRKGTFTTQKSWLWCTAADVQIIRNVARHQTDHSTTSQRRYFNWMRLHNRYTLPLSAGVDPAGWTAGLRHFVDDRYRLVASRTFAAALKSAVTNLRQTNLPVGLTVANGGHAWVLTGFTATADPLSTTSFTVTSVRVVGPLFGLQSRNGYDMPPDTKLTPAQLRHYFTPWKYAPKRMIWDGTYVSIQPIPTTSAPTAPAGSPAASASASSSAPPSPDPSASSTEFATASPATTAGSADPSAIGPATAATTSPSPGGSIAAALTTTGSDGVGPGLAIAILVVGLAGAIMAVGIGRSFARPRAARRPRPAPHARPAPRPRPHR
jgi:hypothetical protein